MVRTAHRHEPPANRILTNDLEARTTLKAEYEKLHKAVRRKHGRCNALQSGLARHQLKNPRLKSLARHRANLQAEAAQNPPDA